MARVVHLEDPCHLELELAVHRDEAVQGLADAGARWARIPPQEQQEHARSRLRKEQRRQHRQLVLYFDCATNQVTFDSPLMPMDASSLN
jgi:hypothetical protein